MPGPWDPTYDPAQQADRLTGALVSQPHHSDLYMRSGVFHQAVDTLAAWLPGWIEAMAEQSLATDEVLRQRALLAAKSPFATICDNDPAHDNRVCSQRRHLAEVMPGVPGCPVTCGCSCHQVPVSVAELRGLRPGDLVRDRTTGKVGVLTCLTYPEGDDVPLGAQVRWNGLKGAAEYCHPTDLVLIMDSDPDPEQAPEALFIVHGRNDPAPIPEAEVQPALDQLQQNLTDSMAAAIEARDRHVAHDIGGCRIRHTSTVTSAEIAANVCYSQRCQCMCHEGLYGEPHAYDVDTDDGAPCCPQPADAPVHHQPEATT